MKVNIIEDVRGAMIGIITYMKSLDTKNISNDVKAELLKIPEDHYRLIDLIHKKLEVPRIPPEDRAHKTKYQ